MEDITSLRNNRVKLVRALQTQTRARRREHKFVVEGVRLLQDALESGLRPEFVLYQADDATLNRQAYQLFADLRDVGVVALSVSPSIMQTISAVESPPGVLGVFEQLALPLPEALSLVLVLDEMRNPGNMGSVLRTASAAGVELVVLSPNAVDPYNPKVLRGGMGAHFRLPIIHAEWDEVALRFGGLQTYLADAGGEVAHFDVDWMRPSMLIIGGEAHGPGADAARIAGATVSIPMMRNTESLNAAVSAGVILYEALRQRTRAAG